MKKILIGLIAVFLLIFSNGIQAQDAAKDLDQLKLMKQFLGEWQMNPVNDTIYGWELKQYGNAYEETDYMIVNGEKSIDSFWSYSFKPERNNFITFAAFVGGGYQLFIGSFTAENKYCQKNVDNFESQKVLNKAEFVFDTPTSITATIFSSDGVKKEEIKFSKVK